jgi:hypothetical protein
MKLLNKTVVFALLAALALASCDTGISPTTPDFTQVNRAYDAVTGSQNAVLPGFPTVAPFGGSIVVDGSASNTIVMVTFPNSSDAPLDVFRGDPDDTTLTTRLREFLSFYNVAPSTGFTPSAKVGADIAYSVVRREGSTVYLNLTVGLAHLGVVVYQIDASKYTYRNGLSLDADGNGEAGTGLTDNGYGRFIVRDQAYSAVPAGHAASIAEAVLPQGAQGQISIDHYTIGGWLSDEIECVLRASLTGLDLASTTDDYTALIRDHVRLLNYANGAYNPVTLTWVRVGNTYTATFRQKAQGLYRVEVKNGIQTISNYYGSRQPVYFDSGSTVDKGWMTYYDEISGYNNANFRQESSIPFWSSVKGFGDSEGLNASLVFTLNFNSYIGNWGLNETIPANSVKLGYENSGKRVVIPTKSISLRYSSPAGKSTHNVGEIPIKDELVIELADGIDLDQLSAYSLNLFISKDYGYRGDDGDDPPRKSGVFGDYTNIDKPVEGVYYFGSYGPVNVNHSGPTPPSPGNKPASLSSTASYTQTIAKLDEIIAYCDAYPGSANDGAKTFAESLMSSILDYADGGWDFAKEYFIGPINQCIDLLD